MLAERAHVADRALRASVRRKNSEGPARILWDAVAERLRGRNVDPGSVEWDAWRREDGRWTVVADYRSGESTRHAEFVFDAPGRYVVAEDDEARWLVGEQTASRGPQPRTATGPAGSPRSAPTTSCRSARTPSGWSARSTRRRRGPTEDLSATAAAVRATGDADWIATQASERPAPVELGSESDPEVAEPEDADPGDTSRTPRQEQAAEPEAPRRSSKKGRRASVPSWDEIMFGGGKRE